MMISRLGKAGNVLFVLSQSQTTSIYSLLRFFVRTQMDEDTRGLSKLIPASTPFDDPQADIILSSSGRSLVHFRTFKQIGRAHV